jgi:hypothetical protein
MITTRILIQKAFVHLVIPTAAKQARVMISARVGRRGLVPNSNEEKAQGLSPLFGR